MRTTLEKEVDLLKAKLSKAEMSNKGLKATLDAKVCGEEGGRRKAEGGNAAENGMGIRSPLLVPCPTLACSVSLRAPPLLVPCPSVPHPCLFRVPPHLQELENAELTAICDDLLKKLDSAGAA